MRPHISSFPSKIKLPPRTHLLTWLITRGPSSYGSLCWALLLSTGHELALRSTLSKEPTFPAKFYHLGNSVGVGPGLDSRRNRHCFIFPDSAKPRLYSNPKPAPASLLVLMDLISCWLFFFYKLLYVSGETEVEARPVLGNPLRRAFSIPQWNS